MAQYQSRGSMLRNAELPTSPYFTGEAQAHWVAMPKSTEYDGEGFATVTTKNGNKFRFRTECQHWVLEGEVDCRYGCGTKHRISYEEWQSRGR